uniref:PIGO_PIGG domain-containing protein n=1 Tax=Heterorhabditis bacteriophora TaxID=37862 RepID=A0A1I7XUB4_HETBA
MTRRRKNRLDQRYDEDPDPELGLEDWIDGGETDIEIFEEGENMIYKRIVGGCVLLLLGIFAFVWGFSASAEFTYKPVQFDKFSYSRWLNYYKIFISRYIFAFLRFIYFCCTVLLLRIHFFGDDTWLRLFPNMFEKHDGVTSFYVNDYTEVSKSHMHINLFMLSVFTIFRMQFRSFGLFSALVSIYYCSIDLPCVLLCPGVEGGLWMQVNFTIEFKLTNFKILAFSIVNTSPEYFIKNVFPLTSTIVCSVIMFWIIRPIKSRDSYYRLRSLFIAVAGLLLIVRALLATLDSQSYGIELNTKILFILFLLCFSSPSCAAILYLFYLIKVETLPIVLICFEMGLLMRVFSSSHYPLAILCQAAFFYQGNSSGLATIDIAVGYQGLSYYEPLIVGLQVIVNLYAGPIALLLGYQFRSGPSSVLFMPYSLIHVRTLLLAVSMLSLFFFSDHIFAYSVFAPKVMCEILHAVVVTVLSCIHFTCSFLSGLRR